jgi:hypothetical protein
MRWNVYTQPTYTGAPWVYHYGQIFGTGGRPFLSGRGMVLTTLQLPLQSRCRG